MKNKITVPAHLSEIRDKIRTLPCLRANFYAIAFIQNRKDIASVIAQLHRRGVSVLWDTRIVEKYAVYLLSSLSLVEGLSLEEWQSYFWWHLIRTAAPYTKDYFEPGATNKLM